MKLERAREREYVVCALPSISQKKEKRACEAVTPIHFSPNELNNPGSRSVAVALQGRLTRKQSEGDDAGPAYSKKTRWFYW